MTNLITLPSDLVEQLEMRVQPGQTIDDLVEEALAGDPASWLHAPRHVGRLGERAADPVDGHRAHVFCRCCDGRCRKSFHWRGILRCGCDDAMVGRPGIVQPDLDRK